MTPRLLLASLLSLTFAGVPTAAFAQRELHWDALAVTAHLNADGTLSVVEDQTIVFTGDWNGGERTFNIRPRQMLSFEALSRWTGATWQPMTESSGLASVDDYAFTDARTLRWRSRLPADPPFASTSRRYALRYALSGILATDGTSYTLDHDFAFPDRPGEITRYNLHLTLDPVWQPETPIRDAYSASSLAPGQGFVLTIPLRYVGAGTPIALDSTRAPEIRLAVQAILGLTLLSIAWMFVSERAKGRFVPVDMSVVTTGWLREHILSTPAELVSAAWDDQIGQAEVVTTIARLTSEGRLASTVSGTRKAPGMSLRLKVDRDTLVGHERALIDGLFFDDRTTTSISEVKSHYKKTGFDPVALIRDDLSKRLKETLPFTSAPWVYAFVTGALFVAAIGFLASAWFMGEIGMLAAFLMFVGGLVVAGLLSIPGAIFRKRMDWGYRKALASLALPCLVAAGVAWFLWEFAGTGEVELLPRTVGGVTAIALFAIVAGINGLRSRQRREGIELRKRLTAGRLFFQRELGKAEPALHDEWYPWVLAFNLGPRMDDWSAQHRTGRRGDHDSFSSSSSHSGSHTSGSTWTGFGGGRSGGAGSSATWAAAAGGFAAGVAPPSSSGSSSGGGGGSSSGGSSGGGGGGGW